MYDDLLNMEYKPKIGLEVHVELATKSKMFCRCENYSLGDDPNTRVCPVCLGLPGALPVLNQKALDLGSKTALGLNCQINEFSSFDRKNYFYPDLPKGYQISQFFKPLAVKGWLDLYMDEGVKRVAINRLHMEEDTAKMTHAGDLSLLDFNRSGIPLMEIVTEPDIESPKEARMFVKTLRDLVVWLGASHARMQLGELRCDANISLLNDVGEQMGEVVEIKNINSFRNVYDALTYEFRRQIGCIENGNKIDKETRGWDIIKQETYVQRKKEYFHDYRYFPEPDLPAVRLTSTAIEKLKSSLEVLPDTMRQKMMVEYELEKEYIEGMLNNIAIYYYFEEVLSEFDRWLADEGFVLEDIFDDRKILNNKVAGFILTELAGIIKSNNNKISPENLAELLLMFYRGDINNKVTKDVLDVMKENGGDPSVIIEDSGWKSFSRGDIELAVDEVISQNASQVALYRDGREQLMSYFIGQVMSNTKGLADPKIAREILVERLRS